MDEETVKWSEERYLDIQKALKPFLKSCGYNIEKMYIGSQFQDLMETT